MNPREFMHAALQLAAGNEALKRSAISRAYCCVYHVARELISSCGVRLPGIASPHETVMRCLENSADDEGETVGAKLRSLRGERNYADYDLSRPSFGDQKFIDSKLRVAQELLSALDQLPRDRIAAKVRAYAQTVLRLVVDA